MMMQLNFRVSKDLVKLLDECIDGVKLRSRGQILNIALSEWLARRIFPVPQHPMDFANSPDLQLLRAKQASRDFYRVLSGEPMPEESRDAHLKTISKVLRAGLEEQECLGIQDDSIDLHTGTPKKNAVFEAHAMAFRQQLKTELLAELRAELGVARTEAGEDEDGGAEPKKERKRKASKP
jgi:hypothetical protein